MDKHITAVEIGVQFSYGPSQRPCWTCFRILPLRNDGVRVFIYHSYPFLAEGGHSEGFNTRTFFLLSVWAGEVPAAREHHQEAMPCKRDGP